MINIEVWEEDFNLGIKVKKTSSYLPEKAVDNFYFEEILDTSDEWISSRTGIRKRHFVKNEEMIDLVRESVKKLELSQEELDKVKYIIVATCTSFYAIPNLASQVQESFDFGNDIYSLDINMACSGFTAGLRLIDGMLREKEYALLIGVEVFSKILDFTDRNTAVLFGDGAGAVLLEHSKEENLFASGTIGNTNSLNYGHKLDSLYMEGKEVYRFGVSTMQKEIKKFLKKIDLEARDIDYFVSHQANTRILESVAKGLGVEKDKFPSNIEEVGNISSASIPVLLDKMNKQGRLKSGDKIVMSGFGAGLTWVLAYMKW